jgi:hypothetical protein
MQEGYILRVELDTKMVTNVTLEWTQMVKNSSSSPRPMFNKRRSKVSRPLIMLLILILMFQMFLICHILISMLIICL